MFKFAVLLRPKWERTEESKSTAVQQLDALETMLFKENRYSLFAQGGGSDTKQLQPLPPFRSQVVLMLAVPGSSPPEQFFSTQLG